MNYIEILKTQLQGMAKGAIEILPSLAIALVVLIIAWRLRRRRRRGRRRRRRGA